MSGVTTVVEMAGRYKEWKSTDSDAAFRHVDGRHTGNLTLNGQMF